MPELPHFNPTVSVFHFTSKVSSAKIRKYKLATERGMTTGHATNGPRSTSQQVKSEPDQDQSKRTRLKLKVRQPTEVADADVIAVRRPARSSNSNKRGWNDAFGKSKQASIDDAREGDSSSVLSSVNHDISHPGSPSVNKNLRRMHTDRPSKSDSYGGFEDWYIANDKDSPTETPDDHQRRHKPSQRSHRAQPATSSHRSGRQHAQAIPVHRFGHSEHGQRDTRFTHHSVPSPQPMVQFPAFESFRVGPPDPVPVMIMKVEALSMALTEFGGGVPTQPLSPELNTQLSDPEQDAHRTILPVGLITGEHDLALTYGIQFIMNALRSWAQQRLTHLHMQTIQQNQHNAMLAQQNQTSNISGQQSIVPEQPLHVESGPINLTLSGTPEGRAIEAFRAVVECGCLRFNTVVPAELARVLRRLYLQIDHLINQGGKPSIPWRCLSYHAQIEANKIRLQAWKDEQARAEQEMVRQHQLSHQQTMRQMGLPSQFTATMFYQQPQDSFASPNDSRRYSQNLIRLPVQATESAAVSQHMPPGANGVDYASHHTGLAAMTASAEAMAGQHLLSHRDKHMTTALLPRSGQSMQFSFTPTNNITVQAFGTQGFPASHNAGPRTYSTTQQATNIAAAVDARISAPSSSKDDTLTVASAHVHRGFTSVNAPTH